MGVQITDLMRSNCVSTKILCEAGCPFAFGINAIKPALEAMQTMLGTQVFENPLKVTEKDLRDKYQALRAQITSEQFREITEDISGSFSFLHLVRMHAVAEQNKQNLDHALSALWQEIAPQLGENRNLNPEEIRTWMTEDAKQPHPRLQEIKFLDLRHKGLMVIPPEIQYLTGLYELDLTDNKIAVIPPEIQQLTDLRGLRLSGNQIRVIPISKLTKLQVINLDGNRIQNVPELESLTDLKFVSLSRNQIKDIPDIKKLTKLMGFDLTNNPIINRPPKTFGQVIST